MYCSDLKYSLWHFTVIYRPLPLCRLRVSRYYHLCRSEFSFPTFCLYISLHFNCVYVETVNMKQLPSVLSDYILKGDHMYCSDLKYSLWHFTVIYRPLPLCRLRVSRYYHLCRSEFSFPTFCLYISLHFNCVYVETVNMKQRVSRGDFSCPRRIFAIIYAIVYVEVKICARMGAILSASAYVHIIAEVRTSSKQQ